MDALHATLLSLGTFDLTAWKLIGFAGGLCFVLRWAIQVWHRRRTGTAEVPGSFWWISLAGGVLTLAYFVFGHPDGVGVMQSAFPALLALYNLWLDRTQRQPAA